MKRLALPLALMACSAASLFLGFSLLRSAAAGFILYYLVSCLALPLIDLTLLRRVPLKSVPALIGFGRPTLKDLALGVGSGAAMVAAMLLALVLLRDRLFGDGRILAALQGWGVPREDLALVFVVMLAFNGALEECFWRGYLHERLSGLRLRAAALALPTLAFGAQHLVVVSSIVADPAVAALFLVGIAGAGAIWAFLRERTGRLLPCVLSHMVVTAGYMLVFLYYVSSPSASP